MLRPMPHFSVGEALRASGGFIPAELEENAQTVLTWLEAARVELGRPILITSLYRSPEHNATVTGAASRSQHLRALAADFDVLGMTNHEAVARLDAAVRAGRVPPYHQLITYTTDHHVHVGVVGETWAADRQNLLELAVGQYRELTTTELAGMVRASAADVAATVIAQAGDAARAFPVPAAVIVALFLVPAVAGGHWT